jgi:Ca-activated chloride channel homolog
MVAAPHPLPPIAMIENPQDASLQFAQPLWLGVGLLVCAALVFFYRKFDRRRLSDLSKMAHPRFLPQLLHGESPALQLVRRVLWIAALFLLFTALARPQMGFEYREVKRRGIDLLFALDTSNSMLADDLSPNRLDRARMGILDFVDRLEGDRVGLVPFAGSAYALCPLTNDYDAFRESLQALNTQMIQHQGTDLATAIREAERLFAENNNNQRILVLITDGEDLQGDVIDAAKQAHKNGMVIYTVGVGNPEGSTIPITYQNGRRDVMRDQNGEIVRTALDESTLREIAKVTKGLYVSLGRGAEGLNTIYQEKLRLVPKSEMSQRMEKIPLERFMWPLAMAVLLLLIEYFLPQRRRDVRAPAMVLILLGLLMMPLPARDDMRFTYNRGTEAYERGEFSAAVDALREALHTPDLALQQRTYYNLGNALYRHGQAAQEKEPQATIKHWESAIKAYEDALALDESDEDALYNRDLVKKKLEQLKEQQQQQNPENQKDQQEQEKKEQEQQEKEKQEQEQQEKEEPQQKEQEQQKQDPQNEKQESSEQEEKDAQEAKQDEAKEGEASEEKEGQPQQAREMTEAEAKQLLESLRHEERRVIPVPQRRDGNTDNTTKGKTW